MNWVSKHHTPHLNNHYSESLAGKWFQSISHSCWWHFSLQLYPCYAESLTLAAEKEFLISPKKSKDRIFLGGYFCLSALFCCLFVFYVFIILYYTWYHHVSAMKVNKYSVLIIFSSHLQVLFYFLFFIHSIFFTYPFLFVLPDWARGDRSNDEVSQVLRPADWLCSAATLPVQSCHHPPPLGFYVPQLLSQSGGKLCKIIQQ